MMLKKQRANEQIITAGTTEVGSVLPEAARSATTVVGNRHGGAQPMSVNVMRSSPAMPSFSHPSFFVAARASGVAAFPMPRKFAASEVDISFTPSPLLAVFGKTRRRIGDKSRERVLRIPPCSATFIIPHQRHIIGRSENATLTARVPPEIAASVSDATFPVKKAHTTDMRIITPEIFNAIACSY